MNTIQTVLLILGLVTLVIAYVLDHRYHKRLIAETRSATRTETRRRIIEHLRTNPRGLVLLDNAYVVDTELPGPLTILGEYALVTGCYFDGTTTQIEMP